MQSHRLARGPGSELILYGLHVANDDERHLVRGEIVVRDATDIVRRDRHDALHVAGKVVVAEAVRVNEGEAADDAAARRILHHEDTGEVVLDAAEFRRGRSFLSQPIYFEQDL